MTTPAIEALALTGQPSPFDPYRYGWRVIERVHEDGTVEVEQIPLTLADVLHPEQGDHVTQSQAHQRRCRYLADVFEARLARDPTAVVLHDVRITWDVPALRPHGPDIAVIQGVRSVRNGSTLDVAVEGVRPALIVEVASPETASLDRTIKVEQYDQAGAPLYVIVGAIFWRQQAAPRLLGYQRAASGYHVLTPDERGWLWLEPVRIWLGIVEGEIVCHDEAGQPLGDYRTVRAALTTAEERAEVAEAALAEAERRAESDRQARLAVEARLRDMEEELRRLRQS